MWWKTLEGKEIGEGEHLNLVATAAEWFDWIISLWSIWRSGPHTRVDPAATMQSDETVVHLVLGGCIQAQFILSSQKEGTFFFKNIYIYMTIYSASPSKLYLAPSNTIDIKFSSRAHRRFSVFQLPTINNEEFLRLYIKIACHSLRLRLWHNRSWEFGNETFSKM